MADCHHKTCAPSRTPLIKQLASSTSTHTECHPLDFKRHVFEPEMRAAMQSAGLEASQLFDHLEEAVEIIAGLATVCRLARNNQALASNASEEGPPLALTTLEDLFNLAEGAAARFISDVKSLALWQPDEQMPEIGSKL